MIETDLIKPAEILFLNPYVNERIRQKTKMGITERAENLQPFLLPLDYFFLCRLALLRFLRLCVATLCLFLFLPLGINSYLFID